MCGISAVILQCHAKIKPSAISISPASSLTSTTTTTEDELLNFYINLTQSTLQSRGPSSIQSLILPIPEYVSAVSSYPTLPNLSSVPSSFTSSFLVLTCSVLHLRGDKITTQPIISSSSPSSRLCFNGEIYEALPNLSHGQNDGAALYKCLLNCQADVEIISLLSSVEGPFSFIYYDSSSNKLWFGRDKFGRRSLVCTISNKKIIISSLVLPNHDSEKWTEVPITGIFCIDLNCDSKIKIEYHDQFIMTHHFYPQYKPLAPYITIQNFDDLDTELISNLSPFRRIERGNHSEMSRNNHDKQAQWNHLSFLLSQSVKRRVLTIPPPSDISNARVAVLFSGGIDCTLLAYFTHVHLPISEPIDLISVSFVGDLLPEALLIHSPDRITSQNSLLELKSITPNRIWRLISVDLTLEDVENAKSFVYDCILPKSTVMDLNLGIIQWFAGRGKGRIDNGIKEIISSQYCRYNTQQNTIKEINEEKKEAELPRSTSSQSNDSNHNSLYGHIWNKQLRREKAKLKRTEARHKQISQNMSNRIGNYSSIKPNNSNLSEEEEKESVPSEDQFRPLSDLILSSSSSLSSLSLLYDSKSLVLLSGVGADELFAGYARHRTKFLMSLRMYNQLNLHNTSSATPNTVSSKSSSEISSSSMSMESLNVLCSELDLDFHRLWLRNFGRDDRLLSSHGRECRHPYLDEQLVEYVRRMNIDSICDLTLPSGIGDKLCLRMIAKTLGLINVSSLQKRAMQFGSRIANRKIVGWIEISRDINMKELVNPLFIHKERRKQIEKTQHLQKGEAKRNRQSEKII